MNVVQKVCLQAFVDRGEWLMDLSKIRLGERTRSRLVVPDEIFRSLTLRGAVENIWDPQGEALRRWHENREKSDVTIEMNTGGGKTLVGLIVAQAIVNETQGKVLYVCPTNQLVEQTAAKARECGLDVTTYMSRTWSGDSYDSCTGPCITNYAAVFNGRSIFVRHDLKGLVLDDAHVAHNTVRSQFTLRLFSQHPAFRDIANLLRQHFARNGQAQQYDDALDGDWQALLFAPMFEVHRNADVMRKILLSNGVAKETATLFAWEHLKDRLSRCVVLVSGGCIEITPPMLPIHTLPYFRDGVRRVYLTATMPSQVEFMRTFGVAEAEHIAPGGKSGEAQRLFLFIEGEDDEQQRASAAELVMGQKACIITPSNRTADQWQIGEKYDGRLGHAGIQAFCETDEPQVIILAARYDGIDLPGTACRVLVMDGLPLGEFFIDRFTDQTLRIERLRQVHMATRIVQAIGRIFRSNTDHGAVLICGENLRRWLLDPNHQQFMPELLQAQVQLGIELHRLADNGEVNYQDLLRAVLSGRPDWDAFYKENISNFEARSRPEEEEWFCTLAVGERHAFARLWDGDFAAAATAYRELAERAGGRDRQLAAWYRHWLGLACDLGGQEEEAITAYVQAVNERAELGRPRIETGRVVGAESVEVSEQAAAIARLMGGNKAGLVARLRQAREALSYENTTNAVEQALSEIGLLLGLGASRPDHEHRTGPDVLWQHDGEPAGLALEAKTNKQAGTQYGKDDIGQVHDHLQWLATTHPDRTFAAAVVGRLLPVSSACNPPGNLLVIPLEQFHGLMGRLQELLEFVDSASTHGDVGECMERGLQHFGLKWPNCIQSLEGRLAVDLQGEQVSPQDGAD